MSQQHELNKGYYFNYLHDAAHCYWAARILELNYRSMDEKDKVVDQLIIRRLRTLADNLVKQASDGLTEKKTESPSEGMDLLKELMGQLGGENE